jgi:hypothetical protein
MKYSNKNVNFAPETGIEPVTRRLTVGCSTAELLRNILFHELSSAETFQLFFSDKSVFATRNFLRVNESPYAVKPRGVTFKYSVVMNLETILNVFGLADINLANCLIEDRVNKIHPMVGCLPPPAGGELLRNMVGV